jgi:hypothetical protein
MRESVRNKQFHSISILVVNLAAAGLVLPVVATLKACLA